MVKGCQKFMDEYDGEFEKPMLEANLAEVEALTRETRDNRPGLNKLVRDPTNVPRAGSTLGTVILATRRSTQ